PTKQLANAHFKRSFGRLVRKTIRVNTVADDSS
uniref:Uncharacterized protein n=1 Tax=Plectus sambesii TaxID=2011161 RepID=A0A914VYC1_9BILA